MPGVFSEIGVLPAMSDSYGESPMDTLVEEKKSITLSSSAATVSTRAKPGNTVYYALFKQATVDADGNIAVAAAVPGASAVVECVILYPPSALTMP